MDLYGSIIQRKSCRKYISVPLDEELLDEIKSVLISFQPLYPDIPFSYRFVTHTKGMFHVKAPHYIVISGQGEDGEGANAGFIGQQFMLWLNSRDLGGVWLGGSKDATDTQSDTDIIVIAFGKPEDSPNRSISEFKRKDISDISNAPQDECIKAVHLAPSGLNLQPWYFYKTIDKVLVYRQILKLPTSLFYKLTEVDIGIALCHFAVACRHFNKPFSFVKDGQAKELKDYEYYGYIDITEQ